MFISKKKHHEVVAKLAAKNAALEIAVAETQAALATALASAGVALNNADNALALALSKYGQVTR